MKISIDVTDWHEEVLHNEIEIAKQEDFAELITTMTPQQLARLAVVMRELKKADEDIIPANKCLLNTGAAVAVTRYIVNQKKSIKTNSGKEVEVREFVGPVREQDSHELSVIQMPGANPESLQAQQGQTSCVTQEKYAYYVAVDDPGACERAIKYLRNKVPGYVRGRLATMVECGGDIVAEAELLKNTIDEIVAELT